MKYSFVCIFVLIALTNRLSAQTQIDNSGAINNTIGDYRFKRITDDNNYRFNPKVYDILGTPYLNNEFQPGKITTTDGAIIADLQLQYNACNDDLEFLQGEYRYAVDPKSNVGKAEFGGKVFSYRQYDIDGKTQGGFFEILTEGKVTLMVKYTVQFFEKEKPQPFVNPKPARFDPPIKQYYLSFDGAPAKLIQNKKKLLELFGNKMEEMESYISKNKLSVKEDESLKKIIVYYNAL
jgi:hypothetical protein